MKKKWEKRISWFSAVSHVLLLVRNRFSSLGSLIFVYLKPPKSAPMVRGPAHTHNCARYPCPFMACHAYPQCSPLPTYPPSPALNNHLPKPQRRCPRFFPLLLFHPSSPSPSTLSTPPQTPPTSSPPPPAPPSAPAATPSPAPPPHRRPLSQSLSRRRAGNCSVPA